MNEKKEKKGKKENVNQSKWVDPNPTRPVVMIQCSRSESRRFCRPSVRGFSILIFSLCSAKAKPPNLRNPFQKSQNVALQIVIDLSSRLSFQSPEKKKKKKKPQWPPTTPSHPTNSTKPYPATSRQSRPSNSPPTEISSAAPQPTRPSASGPPPMAPSSPNFAATPRASRTSLSPPTTASSAPPPTTRPSASGTWKPAPTSRP